MRRSRKWMLAFLASCLVFARSGVSTPTLEQIRGYAFPSSLVASRTGARIAWLVDDHGHRNVWVAEGPAFEPRQITFYSEDDGQELSSLGLSSDAARVVFVRGGDHGSSWDPDVAANVTSMPTGARVEIWSAAFDGSERRRLAEGDYPTLSPDNRRLAFRKNGGVWVVPLDGSTEAKPLFTARGRIESAVWSPDGTRLAFVSSRGTHAFIGVFTDEHTPILWLSPAIARDTAPRWSPDGKRIAFVRLAASGGPPAPMLEPRFRQWGLWIADASIGEARLRWKSSLEKRDSYAMGYFDWPVGNRIVFQSYRDGWLHLYSIADTEGEPLQLTAGGFSVDEVVASRDRRELIFTANTGASEDDMDRRHLFRVPVDSPEPKAITHGEGLEWAPAPLAGNTVAFIRATARLPPVPVVLGASGESRPLRLPASTDYPARQLVVPKRIDLQAEDGVRAHGQLFLPVDKGRKAGKMPAVVYLHGGPRRQMLLGWHPMAYYSNDYALNQYLASRGFVVLALNYRLGTGYGYEFQFAEESGSRGAAEYRDVRAAGRYLQSLPGVDASCVGLYGGSYGGYLTAMGLAHDSDLFSAGADIHGVHDLTAGGDFADAFVRKRYEMAPDAGKSIEVAWESSPVSALATWKSPVLVVHGDDDRNVEFAQSVDLVRRLEAAGIPSESLVLVDETHSILRYENALRTNKAVADFFARRLCR